MPDMNRPSILAPIRHCLGCGREAGRGSRLCSDCEVVMAENMIDPEQPRISDDSIALFFGRGASDDHARDWALDALAAAEAEGFTGMHACLSAAGWRGQDLRDRSLRDHLLSDGEAAAAWVQAKHEK